MKFKITKINILKAKDEYLLKIHKLRQKANLTQLSRLAANYITQHPNINHWFLKLLLSTDYDIMRKYLF
jgi:hypothetical protein